MRDTDDAPCNRCKGKGRSCGESRLPKDDTNRRIRKRTSTGCQTEEPGQSSEVSRVPNSAVQDQTQLGHSAATAAATFGDFPQLGETGGFMNLAVWDDGREDWNTPTAIESRANFIFPWNYDFESNVKIQR